MSNLRELKRKILEEGVDGEIHDSEVALIREHLPAAGKIDPEDLKVLAEMRSEARSVCPAFDQLFFPAFKASLLADGEISLAEQFYLLRMLYGGGKVDDAEKQFLRELRRDVKKASPEFEALCHQALKE